MTVEEVMKRYGFELSASCAGPAWYTKVVTYQERRAFVTVTDQSGDGLPTTLDEPVRVGIHDLKSGDELEESRNFSSLDAYLKSLED
jgi:hypothetical protein